ncbi:hypothetical protein QJQ45_020591, partial [Haematococcus lacustris]
YIYSYYFSISTYTGLGDADFGTSSVAESCFMVFYMALNLVVAAYILGTVSMLMVKADKRSKVFRDRMTNLRQFSSANNVPQALHETLKEHLELHFHNEQNMEETVLQKYPLTIRRRVMRHLYASTVRHCYLFKNCKAKFADAVLAAVHVELFLPGVQILCEGDIVNELMIVVEGEVLSTRPARNLALLQEARLRTRQDPLAARTNTSCEGYPPQHGTASHLTGALSPTSPSLTSPSALDFLDASLLRGQPSLQAWPDLASPLALPNSTHQTAEVLRTEGLLHQLRFETHSTGPASPEGTTHGGEPDGILAGATGSPRDPRAGSNSGSAAIAPGTLPRSSASRTGSGRLMRSNSIVPVNPDRDQAAGAATSNAPPPPPQLVVAHASYDSSAHGASSYALSGFPTLVDSAPSPLTRKSHLGNRGLAQGSAIPGIADGIARISHTHQTSRSHRAQQSDAVLESKSEDVSALRMGAVQEGKFGLGVADASKWAPPSPSLGMQRPSGGTHRQGLYHRESGGGESSADNTGHGSEQAADLLRNMVPGGIALAAFRNATKAKQLQEAAYASVHGSRERALAGELTPLGQSECVGEVAFFTAANVGVDVDADADADADPAESASQESVWSNTMVRVMVLSTTAFEKLTTAFPQQTRHMLSSLEQRCNEDLRLAWARAIERATFIDKEVLEAGWEYVYGKKRVHMMPEATSTRLKMHFGQAERKQLERAELITSAARQHNLKVDQMRVYDFLNAASAGNMDIVKAMLAQGNSPNSADYDKRTGLMLACHEGHENVAKLLLESGADPMSKDNFGNTAMYEAVKMGHDGIMDLLLTYKASLGVEGIMVAAQMCTCVFDGDLVTLRRILRSGCDPDAADYDRRCALHIAACEGNLTAVKVLIEEGGATVDFPDRWGNTAMDEATRVGARPVTEFLAPLMQLAKEGKLKSMAAPHAPTYAQLFAKVPSASASVSRPASAAPSGVHALPMAQDLVLNLTATDMVHELDTSSQHIVPINPAVRDRGVRPGSARPVEQASAGWQALDVQSLRDSNRMSKEVERASLSRQGFLSNASFSSRMRGSYRAPVLTQRPGSARPSAEPRSSRMAPGVSPPHMLSPRLSTDPIAAQGGGAHKSSRSGSEGGFGGARAGTGAAEVAPSDPAATGGVGFRVAGQPGASAQGPAASSTRQVSSSHPSSSTTPFFNAAVGQETLI